jgi:tetratricopeptide (TPR) repeat protein
LTAGRIYFLRLRHIANTADRLRQERDLASRTVEPLLHSTPENQWHLLVDDRELRTCGAVERLGNIFADTLTKQPLRATAIAELAVSLAEGMDLVYPAIILAQIQAHAWKDYGKAMRFIGRNTEAIQSFHTAEQKLEPHGILAHDRAIVHFNLAISLQEMKRFDESLPFLVDSREVFREHGDSRNAILCGLAEGVLLQRMGKYREARETYRLLLASTANMDTESLAAVHHAIGFCSIDLRDFAHADASLRHAIALYREVGQPLVILKVELGRGRLFIRTGQAQSGITHLQPVRREFLKHGMHEEAGICGLEIVEGFLMLNRPAQAETLARKLVGEFSLAHLDDRATAARAYVTQAIAARKASGSRA